jgi:hypothetical protein
MVNVVRRAPYQSLSSRLPIPQAGGLLAISRWLSAATPPVRNLARLGYHDCCLCLRQSSTNRRPAKAASRWQRSEAAPNKLPKRTSSTPRQSSLAKRYATVAFASGKAAQTVAPRKPPPNGNGMKQHSADAPRRTSSTRWRRSLAQRYATFAEQKATVRYRNSISVQSVVDCLRRTKAESRVEHHGWAPRSK